jgi:hypothetical protein
MLPMYLTHATAIRITQQYLNVSQFAQEIGKPFMMFETNSASCGGFPGISDAFAAALWGLDYGLMMATVTSPERFSTLVVRTYTTTSVRFLICFKPIEF